MSDSRRYRATVAYVGTAFHGWQMQKNAPRTVQAVLEDALRHIARTRVCVEAASRTDKGVHADGQVVHFDLPEPWDPRAVLEAVNDRVAEDVRLLAVDVAKPGFHARYDARWKEYLYRWSRAAVIPPRDFPFVASISPRAEAGLMREAARQLTGTRDFGVFGVQRGAQEPATRTLSSIAIREDGAELRALFRGDGFVRGMVRSICGVLSDSARGRVPTERGAELLETGDRRLLSHKAAARGLTLVRVGY